jgi:hypothetical protein
LTPLVFKRVCRALIRLLALAFYSTLGISRTRNFV